MDASVKSLNSKSADSFFNEPIGIAVNGWKWDKNHFLILIGAIIFAAYSVWLVFLSNQVRLKNIVSTFVLILLGVVGAFLAVRAARNSALEQKLRTGWMLLGGSFAIVLCSNILRFSSEIFFGFDAAPFWLNFFYLASYPLLLAGLMKFPNPFRSKDESRRFWLDSGTLFIGAGMVLWYLLIRPVVYAPNNSIYQASSTLAFPLFDFILLFGVAVVCLRGRSDLRRTMTFLAAAFLSNLIGDINYALLTLSGASQSREFSVVFYTAAFIFYALSAYFQGLESSRVLPESVIEEDISQTISVQTEETVEPTPSFSFLPYISIAVGYGMLLFAAFSLRSSADGSPIYGMIFGSLALTGLVIGRQIIVVRENIRLHKEHIEQMSERRFRSLVQNSSDVVSIIGGDMAISYITPSVERVFGYAPEEIIGKKFNDLIHPDEAAHAVAHFKMLMKTGGLAPSVEWRLQHSDGEWIYVENTANNLFTDPNVRGIVVNSRNVTDRRRAEDRMLHDAFHDALTGLPNRALFLDHLVLALNRASRNSDVHFAVLFLDLDRFKFVNDSLGHHAGDLLLIEVARRIEQCLRVNDTVARIGGDEFTVLLEDLDDQDEAAIIAERIQEAISAPFNLDGREFFTTASIGIAPNNSEYHRADDILRDADTAMYHAKVSGKARYAVFDSAMHARAISTMETEADLRRALERGEFFLLYQPIISTSKYTLVGFESLVRWNHPTRGLVHPDKFIALAEETGLIIPMSLWILQEACTQLQKWRKSLPNAPLTVSVNISCKHFQQPDLVEQVAQVLTETGLDPSALKLEITESAVMENTERTAEKLKGLRALGVELSLDDFGTGYSSLSYLHRFPLDTLKIDRTFVSRLEEKGEHHEIVRTIISLAKSLGMKTIAEGVETEKQLLRLQSLGCDSAQGFFFSRPLSTKIVGEMLVNMREAIF